MATENKKYRGVFLDEKDKPIEGSEFTDWKSRSVAVTCFITSKTHDGQYEFLLEKRGPGCPDEIGKLVAPCGYFSWGETLREAAVREVYEEIGLKLNPLDLMFAGINDDPTENRQNVTIWFMVEVPEKELVNIINNFDADSQKRGGEAREVDEVMLVPYFYVTDHADEFGFGHDKIIKAILTNLSEIRKGFFIDALCRRGMA